MATAPAATSLVGDASAPLKLLPASVATAGPSVAKTVVVATRAVAASAALHERSKERRGVVVSVCMGVISLLVRAA